MKRALAAVLTLAPRAASACAVCFGQADGKVGFYRGIFWGIVILLAVTMGLLGGIVGAVWAIERDRAKRGA
jgi:hypothetical protein